MTVNVALVGLGYWGPNLARNLAAASAGRLHTLCDVRWERVSQIAAQYPGVRVRTDYGSVLEDPDVHAAVIATPVHTHFELAAAALRTGKHVLVEKPLAQTSKECRELIALAEDRKLVLMAGHVFLYNAAVRKVKEYLDAGLVGKVYYIYSQRLNLGIIRRDVNALWNFAPHDISVFNYWLGEAPIGVVARGYSYLQPEVEDVVFMTLDYPGGVGANVHISWLDPHKIRRMTVVGSEKMIVYDDVNAEARVMIYDKGVIKKAMHGASPNANGLSFGRSENFGEFQLLLRAGDVLIPRIDAAEPLRLECQHFIECIIRGERPLSDGYDGLRVVQALEEAQASLKQNGVHMRIADR